MPEDTDLYAAAKAEGAVFGITQAQGEAIEQALGLSPASLSIKPVLPINKRGKDYRGRNVARAVSKLADVFDVSISGLVIDEQRYLGSIGRPFSLTVQVPDGSGSTSSEERVFFVDEIDPPQQSEEFLGGTITASSDPDIGATPVA